MPDQRAERNRVRQFVMGAGAVLSALAVVAALFAVVGLGFWLADNASPVAAWVYGVVALAGVGGLVAAFGER